MISAQRLVWLLLCLLVTACSEPADVPVIRVGHASHDHHAALFVAALRPAALEQKAGGHLEEVEYRSRYDLYLDGRLAAHLHCTSGTGGSQLIRKLHDRQFDLAIGGVPAMLQAMDAGSPMRIIAPVMTEGAGLALRKDIPIDDWDSFARYAHESATPLRIGYKTADSVQNIIFEQALDHEHLPYSKSLEAPRAITLVDMHGPDNLIPGVRDGIIDGFVVMQPYLALAEEELGMRTVAQLNQMPPKGKWRNIPCCALAVVDSAYAEDNKEVLAGFLRILHAAHDYIAEYPKDAAEAVAQWLENPVAVERRSLPTIQFMNDFTPRWDEGMRFWIHALSQEDRLKGVLAHADTLDSKLEHLVYDMHVIRLAHGNRE